MIHLHHLIHEHTTEAYNQLASAWVETQAFTTLTENQQHENEFAIAGFSNAKKDERVTEHQPTVEEVRIQQEIHEALRALGWLVIDSVMSIPHHTLIAKELPNREWFLQIFTCLLEEKDSLKVIQGVEQQAPVLDEHLTPAEAFEKCNEAYFVLRQAVYQTNRNVLIEEAERTRVVQDLQATLDGVLPTQPHPASLVDQTERLKRWLKRTYNRKVKGFEFMKAHEVLPSDEETSKWWQEWYNNHPEEHESTDEETEQLVQELNLKRLR